MVPESWVTSTVTCYLGVSTMTETWLADERGVAHIPTSLTRLPGSECCTTALQPGQHTAGPQRPRTPALHGTCRSTRARGHEMQHMITPSHEEHTITCNNVELQVVPVK